MRSIAKLMKDWQFTGPNGVTTAVELPHTWNAKDGQDGGNDYYRGTCWYTLALAKPTVPAGGKAVLQLDGAAMTAAGIHICRRIFSTPPKRSTHRPTAATLTGFSPMNESTLTRMICGMTSQASSTINRIATRYASKMATHRQRLEYFNSLAWKNAAAELLDLPPFCAR